MTDWRLFAEITEVVPSCKQWNGKGRGAHGEGAVCVAAGAHQLDGATHAERNRRCDDATTHGCLEFNLSCHRAEANCKSSWRSRKGKVDTKVLRPRFLVQHLRAFK